MAEGKWSRVVKNEPGLEKKAVQVEEKMLVQKPGGG